ncbi:bromodomain-containing protein 8 isoform X2 [Canis lupus familiaris]|uniref:bromodomain-containing protein 8 isoform X2 n=1 Tax=Canis lupus familiaris TaxID=9615 RepID=UPI000BAA149D|nr:bromodomain-containing protein 8 isoform X2 [Canis lupus familiaris]XP_025289134.1 bromodomain-containing protein 8 isoform X2 [Canis lupus dingo]XP_038408212.1 bromodomain-containing protein 8 isoform X2 [Canis lupus familiaris]XP_038537569.1 bromodomain-containing protein 8 isoform X2 [Canis lupus familiaris]|eukprot:XP_022281057.1 bromodomain-containing protein 8 isoform X2 [Canis lupus familiaris]
MATGTGKHKLLSTGPTEPWSIREKLCLASSVMRSGDQNWVSVSRAIKPFAEPGRPPDWFSQKHCASQYSELLETTETPKRKRGEKGEVVETVEDVIVRKLTAERVEELKKVIKETQEKYRRLKRDAELIQAGHMDSRLDELCNDIVMKKKLEEEEAEVKRKATDAAYQARQAVKTPPRRLPTVMVRSPIDSASPGGDYPLGDLTATTMEEATSGVTPGTLPSTPVTSFPGIPDTLPPGSAPLEAPMTPVTDDSPQKKMLGQKATPPPSPLLSELLKKGSLLPTSPRLVNESEMAVASGHLNSTGVLLEVGGVLPMIHGGEMQQTPNTVAASPAASGAPTLSRLLEAGPTQFTTPLASFTTVASEPPVKLVPPPVESVSQATIVMMPALPTPSSAPAVSTPESVAPVSQPDTCVPMEAVGDPHTVTVSMDSSEISMIINSIKEECFRSGVAEAPGGSKAPSIDGKEDLDLAEKMDIAVSYTGEELDFETVGDIIAIIEDKVDDHPEVLDVAAVEAALSFCEENDDPQSLPGPWEHPIQQERDKPVSLPAPEMTVKQERLDFEETENKGIHELVDIREPSVEIKMEPAEPEQGISGPEIVAGVVPAPSMEPPELRSQELDEEPRSIATGEIAEADVSSGKGDETPLTTVKTEASPESMLSPSHGSNPIEDPLEAETQHKFEMSDSLKEESGTIFGSQIKDAPGEDEEEDGVSEAASLEEAKEEDQGEGYLSEMDNEPPVSESDDGFSIHNATLQSHTLADSIPSSPASSQFSVCSEDQEAIQAQKIWKKAIMLVWRAAANHRYANVFLQPVTDDIAPGYHSIVQRPMDLSTIKKNIENGLIRSTAEFQRDIMLMFQNAVMYNSSDHDVYHMAVEMQRDVLEQIQQFLATQLIMQTSESGISAKSLRGRDSTRKQDSSEKMGHEWVWFDSEPDYYPNDSELSNDCRSLFSSWDSSLDLDVGSWRETEEPGAEELEESSPGREPSELLVGDGGSEESQEEAEQVSRQNLLHFLSEVAYLMEPLCISSKESNEGHCLSSGTRQQEEREMEATEGEEPCREPEQLSARLDPMVAEKPLGKNGRPEVAPAPSDVCVIQRLSTESEEGEVQQESKEEDQGEGYVSEMEDQPSSTECDDGFSIQETPLVDILFSRATSSTLSDLGQNDPVQDHLLFKKTLLPVWKMIASHRFSSPFLKPVSERQAPGYKDVVKRPMDLTSLKRNLSKGRIRTMAQFQRDLMLMFQNAVMYNDSDHHVYHMAVEMQREVLEQIQVLSIWLDKRRDLNSLE